MRRQDPDAVKTEISLPPKKKASPCLKTILLLRFLPEVRQHPIKNKKGNWGPKYQSILVSEKKWRLEEEGGWKEDEREVEDSEGKKGKGDNTYEKDLQNDKKFVENEGAKQREKDAALNPKGKSLKQTKTDAEAEAETRRSEREKPVGSPRGSAVRITAQCSRTESKEAG